MANAPVLFLAAGNYPDDPAALKRLDDWRQAAYVPLAYHDPWWTRNMTYKIAEDNVAYPDRLFLWHYENVRALDKSGTDPARIAYREDQE